MKRNLLKLLGLLGLAAGSPAMAGPLPAFLPPYRPKTDGIPDWPKRASYRAHQRAKAKRRNRRRSAPRA